MLAPVRLARTAAPLARRALATAAASSSSSPAPASHVAAVPLSNIEAQWAMLSNEERLSVHEQLEVVQRKDWKNLSIDEKKAAYYVAFGPHGPRAPVSPPGQHLKVFLGTMALVGVGAVMFYSFRAFAPPPPKTLTKEWEEASTERAREMKLNPITGISSEGYSGKGFVVSSK